MAYRAGPSGLRLSTSWSDANWPWDAGRHPWLVLALDEHLRAPSAVCKRESEVFARTEVEITETGCHSHRFFRLAFSHPPRKVQKG